MGGVKERGYHNGYKREGGDVGEGRRNRVKDYEDRGGRIEMRRRGDSEFKGK